MNLTYDMGVGQVFPIRITFGRLYRANSNGCYIKKKKYSLQETAQGGYLTGGVLSVRFSM